MVPILSAAIAIILILAAAPFEAVRQVAMTLSRFVSSVLGDSYVLISSPARRSAIYSAVRDEICRVCKKCRQVCVIGHSQGAAIAQQVLAANAPHNVKLLITFGSGLQKLTGLQDQFEIQGADLSQAGHTRENSSSDPKLAAIIRAKRRVRSSVANVFLSAAACLLSGILLIHFASGVKGAFITIAELGVGSLAAPLFMLGVSGRDWISEVLRFALKGAKVIVTPIWVGLSFWLPGWILGRFDVVIAILALSFSFSYIWLAVRSNIFISRDVLDYGADAGRFRIRDDIPWFDYFAAKDPVPNGPLWTGSERADWWSPGFPVFMISGHKIHNRNSAWGDHTTYWKNIDEFVTQSVINAFYVSHLMEKGTLKKLSAVLQQTVGHARVVRVRGRQIAMTYLLATILIVSAVYWVFVHPAPPLWLENVSAWIASWRKGLIDAATVRGWTAQVIIVATGAIAYLAIAAAWNVWDGVATDKGLRGLPNNERSEKAFLIFASSAATAAGLLLIRAMLP
ncbi:MAG TPA: hypothetical protein VGF24_27210 [Vicinamibacterales bacterium]|jgi:hypothetical protein